MNLTDVASQGKMEKDAARYVGSVMGEVVCSMSSRQRATRMLVGFKVTGFLFLCTREKREHRKTAKRASERTSELWFSKALRKQDNSTMRCLASLVVTFLFL